MKLSKLDNIKIVMILSYKGKKFKVARTGRSKLFKNCKGTIPINEDVIKSGKILDKMIAYLESSEKPPNNVPAIANSGEFDVCDWDKKFLDIPEEEICEIMLAANYLDIPELLDLCAYKLATLFKTSALQSPS